MTIGANRDLSAPRFNHCFQQIGLSGHGVTVRHIFTLPGHSGVSASSCKRTLQDTHEILTARPVRAHVRTRSRRPQLCQGGIRKPSSLWVFLPYLVVPESGHSPRCKNQEDHVNTPTFTHLVLPVCFRAWLRRSGEKLPDVRNLPVGEVARQGNRFSGVTLVRLISILAWRGGTRHTSCKLSIIP